MCQILCSTADFTLFTGSMLGESRHCCNTMLSVKSVPFNLLIVILCFNRKMRFSNLLLSKPAVLGTCLVCIILVCLQLQCRNLYAALC